MDPNEAHKELARLAAQVMSNDSPLDPQEQMEFAAHFQALDDWIKSGGFPPHAWTTRKTYVVAVSADPELADHLSNYGQGDKPVTGGMDIAYCLRLAERIASDQGSGIVTVQYAELYNAVEFLDRLKGYEWTVELHPAYDQIVAELAVRDHAAALDHPQHRKPECPDLAGNWFDHVEQGGA